MNTMAETNKKVRLHARQTYEELKAMLHKLSVIREHDDTLLKVIPIISKLEKETLEAMTAFYEFVADSGILYEPPAYRKEETK